MLNLEEIKKSGSISPAELEELFAGKPANPVAELQQSGALDKFAGTEIMGIPIGGAVIGVGVAAAINALAAKFLPGQAGFLTKPVGKVVLAYVANQYLAKPLGRKTADAIAFVLVADAVRGYIEPMISKTIGGTATLSQTMKGNTVPGEVTSIAAYNAMMGIR